MTSSAAIAVHESLDMLRMLLEDAKDPRRPLPHQIPPTDPWFGWLLLGGRGSGKTEACSRFVHEHVKGPACMSGPAPHRIGIIGPTQGDAIESCVNGPSGLKAFIPSLRVKVEPGGAHVRWDNGSEAKLFGAHTKDDIERLRAGGNRCLFWLEELAAWRWLQEAYEIMLFGLRAGDDPRWVGSTTPKPRPLIKNLKDDPLVETYHATTDDNPHLPEHIRRMYFNRYGGRQIGRQELYGEIIDEDEDALWRRTWIEAGRVLEAPELVKITVGVDPSGGSGEQGIVVVGKGYDRHGYVLADRSCCLSPEGWGRQAVQAWLDFEADDIVGEVNYGGDMIVSTIKVAARHMAEEVRLEAEAVGSDDEVTRKGLLEEATRLESIVVNKVTASRGKKVRAEPVSAMYEVSPPHAHHVGAGGFPELEGQMCTWVPESGLSPDRLDAMVWGFWHLKMVSVWSSDRASFGGSKMRRRIA